MNKIDIKSMVIGFLMSTNIFFFMGLGDSKIVSHTHDADEVDYVSYKYYSYGTIGKALKDLKGSVEDFSSHDHYGDLSPAYHNHDGDYSSTWHQH